MEFLYIIAGAAVMGVGSIFLTLTNDGKLKDEVRMRMMSMTLMVSGALTVLMGGYFGMSRLSYKSDAYHECKIKIDAKNEQIAFYKARLDKEEK